MKVLQLESIYMSIDFQYKSEAVRKLEHGATQGWLICKNILEQYWDL